MRYKLLILCLFFYANTYPTSKNRNQRLHKRQKTFQATLENINTLTITPNVEKKAAPLSMDDIVDRIRNHKPIDHTVAFNDELFHMKNGIKPEKTVFIFSRGYAGRGGAAIYKNVGNGMFCASLFINTHIINGPCITFDYKDTRNWFNFAQKSDQACFGKVFEETARNTDIENIILVGSCQGATTILNYIAQADKSSLKKVRAILLESPGISLKNLSYEVANHHIGRLPFRGVLIHTFFRGYFPHYDAKAPSTLDYAPNIPRDIPILIGHLQGDHLVSDETMHTLVSSLREVNPHVEFVTVVNKKANHATLHEVKRFCQLTNAFFKKHGLPHNEALAAEWKEYRQKAQS